MEEKAVKAPKKSHVLPPISREGVRYIFAGHRSSSDLPRRIVGERGVVSNGNGPVVYWRVSHLMSFRPLSRSVPQTCVLSPYRVSACSISKVADCLFPRLIFNLQRCQKTSIFIRSPNYSPPPSDIYLVVEIYYPHRPVCGKELQPKL